jgi:hypothetical protein
MNKLLISILLSISAFAAQAECYSEGIRSGIVQKFSSKGLVNKSWEGEMVQDGIRTKQNSGITNIWKFSVLKPEVAKKIETLMFDGKPVTVKYCQSFIRNPLVSNTNYEVVDVK